MIYLIVYVSEDCSTCNRVITAAKAFVKENNKSNYELVIKNNRDSINRISITPAVFINENLFCYGDFDSEKLTNYIKNHLSISTQGS